MKYLTAGLAAALVWAPPLYAIAHNQLAPSYESALGVAYAWVFGALVGLVAALVLGVASARWPGARPSAYAAAGAWLLLLAGFPFANSGGFSVVS